MTTKGTRVLNCRVANEVYAQFEEIANLKGLTVGEYLRSIIEKGLKNTGKTPQTSEPVTPQNGCVPVSLEPVTNRVNPTKLLELAGVKMDGNRIVGIENQRVNPIEAPQRVNPTPLYNPVLHKAGDKVLVQRGKRLVETVIPELDADGHPIYC